MHLSEKIGNKLSSKTNVNTLLQISCSNYVKTMSKALELRKLLKKKNLDGSLAS